jgi:hypothetical protein
MTRNLHHKESKLQPPAETTRRLLAAAIGQDLTR